MESQDRWPDPPPPLPTEGPLQDPTLPLNRQPTPSGYVMHEPFEHVERVERYNVTREPGRLTREELLEQRAERRAYAVMWVKQVVYLVLGVLETLLVLRFALKLLAANPNAAFTSFVYGLTEPFVTPFEGVFPTPGTHGTILDLAAVLAMIVYALLAWGIVNTIFTFNTRRGDAPVL